MDSTYGGRTGGHRAIWQSVGSVEGAVHGRGSCKAQGTTHCALPMPHLKSGR